MAAIIQLTTHGMWGGDRIQTRGQAEVTGRFCEPICIAITARIGASTAKNDEEGNHIPKPLKGREANAAKYVHLLAADRPR